MREKRGERREEGREERREERRERREETGERRGGKRGEKRGERREEKRERREERGERREERREKREAKRERREERREKREVKRERREEERERREGEERREEREERGEKREEEKEEKGMTPDLRLLSGFARGVSLSLHVRVTCLHSGSWLLSGFFLWSWLCAGALFGEAGGQAEEHSVSPSSGGQVQVGGSRSSEVWCFRLCCRSIGLFPEVQLCDLNVIGREWKNGSL